MSLQLGRHLLQAAPPPRPPLLPPSPVLTLLVGSLIHSIPPAPLRCRVLLSLLLQSQVGAVDSLLQPVPCSLLSPGWHACCRQEQQGATAGS